MPRKSNWHTSETKAIRVPAELADQLLALAHAMEDQQNRFVQNKPEPTKSAMITTQSLSGEIKNKVVTAPASVWAEARQMATDFLASPAVAALSKSERLALAALLPEKVL